MSDIENALDGMDEVQQALAAERAAQAESEGMAILGAMVEAAYIVAVADGSLSENETHTLIRGLPEIPRGGGNPKAATRALKRSLARWRTTHCVRACSSWRAPSRGRMAALVRSRASPCAPWARRSGSPRTSCRRCWPRAVTPEVRHRTTFSSAPNGC